jgi:hypothetical protein
VFDDSNLVQAQHVHDHLFSNEYQNTLHHRFYHLMAELDNNLQIFFTKGWMGFSCTFKSPKTPIYFS